MKRTTNANSASAKADDPCHAADVVNRFRSFLLTVDEETLRQASRRTRGLIELHWAAVRKGWQPPTPEPGKRLPAGDLVISLEPWRCDRLGQITARPSNSTATVRWNKVQVDEPIERLLSTRELCTILMEVSRLRSTPQHAAPRDTSPSQSDAAASSYAASEHSGNEAFACLCVLSGLIMLVWAAVRFLVFAGPSWQLVGWVAAVFFLSIGLASAFRSRLGVLLTSMGVPLCGLVGSYQCPQSFAAATPWVWWGAVVIWGTAMVGCGGFASLVQGASTNCHQGVTEAQRARPPWSPSDE